MSIRIGRSIARALIATLAFLLVSVGSIAPASAQYVEDAITIEDVRWSTDFYPEHADVLRLYRAFFDREAEALGAKYWIAQYNSGASLDDIAWVFANGPEFQTKYGATTDSQFLTILYANVLGRAYDQDGFDYCRPQSPAEMYLNALPVQSDFPGMTVSQPNIYAPYEPYDECDSTRPYGGVYVSLERNGAPVYSELYDEYVKPRYIANIIPLRTNAEASEFMAYVSNLTFNCFGYSGIAPSGLGDESIAGDFYGDSPTFHYVRQGNVVLLVWDRYGDVDPDGSQTFAVLQKLHSNLVSL